MDFSTPCLPVHHQLLEFTQAHVHWVSDAIQPSHPQSVPFSSRPQSFPASGSFPMSQFFPSGAQRVGASASASVLPMSIQGWFPLGWTGQISLLSKGLSRVFSNTTAQKHQFFRTQPSLWFNSHIMAGGKTVALTTWTFCGKGLLLYMLSRFVIAFLPRNKYFISWLQSPFTVILEPK